MFKGKKILAIIPARSGSKGIKNKNIKKIDGIPLLGYTILAAKKSEIIDYIFVSTDSKRYAAIAKSFGAQVPFLRGKEISSDKSKTIDCIIYTLNRLKKEFKIYFDVLILLQPTSPLRDETDIRNSLELFFKNGEVSLSSVNETNVNPYLLRFLETKNSELKKVVDANSTIRRQDIGVTYIVNGAIYINSINEIDSNTSFNDNIVGYVMNPEHSIDIDTIEDFKEAKKIIKFNKKAS